MTHGYFRGVLSVLVLAAALSLLGCPPAAGPRLSVTPSVLNFGGEGVEESLAIYNSGSGALTWSLAEDIDWLAADAAQGTVTDGTGRVTLTVDRTGLGPGSYYGTFTLQSNGGSMTISVAMKVPGTPQLQVNPLTLNLLGDVNEGTLTLGNTGDDTLNWNVSVVDPENPTSTLPLPDYLSVSPSVGALAPAGEATVTVAVDREILGDAPGSLALVINSNGGSRQVTVNISGTATADLVVTPKVLDFGEELNQMTFDVYNNGAAGSVMDFEVSTDRPDLFFLSPEFGSSVGTTDLVKDIVSIAVTLDRSAMRGSSDGGKIFVTVPGKTPAEVLATAEAAPLVFEGAINRTRPPFILRFIFLLRDHLGKAIDSNDPAILAQLQNAFTLVEDDVPIDTDETNFFVSDGRNLKYNVGLLLDYTGSMFNAGDGNGTAIAQMVASAKEFVRDLPPSYRVGVMEYHDRQQGSRLVHNFSTNRDSIVAAMESFQVPPNEHGASEVLDAIVDACQRLENEDEGVLSFDDADVRALVFISDGRDTSSVHSLQEAITAAEDARVRLYPIGFGQGINSSMLIQLATKTGGHYYPAPTLADLVNLLEHEFDAPPGAPGLIATELSRQIVLTYITLKQDGQHTYYIKGTWEGNEGTFRRDAVVAIDGDVRAGQIALTTSGIDPNNRAEVFIRTDYVPRNVTQLRFRLLTNQNYTIELAPGGLIEDWVLVDEGGGIYTALTTPDKPLRYGAFGNLFKVTFPEVASNGFLLGFRVDNRILVNPPFTKFFQYPDSVPVARDQSATATVLPLLVTDGFNPDAPGAWDFDGDTVPDFEDMFPADEDFSK